MVNMQFAKSCLLALTLAIAACDHGSHSTLRNDSKEVTISNAWVRSTPAGTTTSALYLNIINSTDKAVSLVGIKSPVTDRVELHETTNENGMMKMAEIPQIQIAAGDSTVLEPGGKHGMLFNLSNTLNEGDELEFELIFKSYPAMPLKAPVQKGAPVKHNH